MRWSHVWPLLASPARPLVLPGVPVVAVGGATLGGSGKTRVAIACAELLRGRGVVFVGHAYRARPGRARLVRRDDPIAEVGDEALVAARTLPKVVVAPSRQAAIDLAVVEGARVIVVDGMLQAKPRRCALAVLAVDDASPWGERASVFPFGDLKADPRVLTALTDVVVRVPAALTTVTIEGETSPVSALRGRRFGWFSALGRPDRFAGALAKVALVPTCVVAIADHGPLRPRDRERMRRHEAEDELDLWLATEKCAVHLERAELRRPIAIVASDPSPFLALLDRALRRALTSLFIPEYSSKTVRFPGEAPFVADDT